MDNKEKEVFLEKYGWRKYDFESGYWYEHEQHFNPLRGYNPEGLWRLDEAYEHMVNVLANGYCACKLDVDKIPERGT